MDRLQYLNIPGAYYIQVFSFNFCKIELDLYG